MQSSQCTINSLMNSNQNIFFLLFSIFNFQQKKLDTNGALNSIFLKKITSYNNNNKQIKRERNLQGIS